MSERIFHCGGAQNNMAVDFSQDEKLLTSLGDSEPVTGEAAIRQLHDIIVSRCARFSEFGIGFCDVVASEVIVLYVHGNVLSLGEVLSVFDDDPERLNFYPPPAGIGCLREKWMRERRWGILLSVDQRSPESTFCASWDVRRLDTLAAYLWQDRRRLERIDIRWLRSIDNYWNQRHAALGNPGGLSTFMDGIVPVMTRVCYLTGLSPREILWIHKQEMLTRSYAYVSSLVSVLSRLYPLHGGHPDLREIGSGDFWEMAWCTRKSAGISIERFRTLLRLLYGAECYDRKLEPFELVRALKLRRSIWASYPKNS